MSRFFDQQIKRQIKKIIAEAEKEVKLEEYNEPMVREAIKSGWTTDKIVKKYKVSRYFVESIMESIPKEDRF